MQGRAPAARRGNSTLAAIPLAPRGLGLGLAQEDHVLAYALLAVVLAALLLAYLWKRRRLRRERS